MRPEAWKNLGALLVWILACVVMSAIVLRWFGLL